MHVLARLGAKEMTAPSSLFTKGMDSRITIDPDVCNGKPTLRGQRITVESILEYLASGD